MRKRAGDHLQGKSLGFTLRLYFISKCVHPHADVTTQANSATRKLLWRMERVEMGLRSYWTPVQPRESGRTTLVGNQEATWVWNTIYGAEPRKGQLLGSSCLDTLSKILKRVMDIQRKLGAIVGKVACWDTVLWRLYSHLQPEQLQGNSFHWTKPHPEETSWHFRHNSKQLSSFKVRICYFLSFSNFCLLKCLVSSLTSI